MASITPGGIVRGTFWLIVRAVQHRIINLAERACAADGLEQWRRKGGTTFDLRTGQLRPDPPGHIRHKTGLN